MIPSKANNFGKGSGRSTKEILKRIDYGGSLCLLGGVRSKLSCVLGFLVVLFQVGSALVFLSMRYNEGLEVRPFYFTTSQTS